MTKGEKTKQRITLCARTLFARKGYLAVTMKDICEAAEISRGGLYAHFSSTGEILEHIVTQEQQAAHSAFKDATANGISPRRIIQSFLSRRIKDICDQDSRITGALNEYARSSETGKRVVQKRASDAVDILTDMILAGQEHAEFPQIDAKNCALRILWLLEGMTAHAELFEMNREFAEEQLSCALRSSLSPLFR